jgi:type I restriction enzyme S subunit
MSCQFQQVELGELAIFKTGKLDSNAAVKNGEYPFFTCSRETFRTNTYSFDDEVVLLAGNNAAGIYPLKYFKGKFDAYQRTYVIRTIDEAKLQTRFLYFALRPLLSHLRDISTGAATKFLTIGLLKSLKIPLPDLPTQKRIAGILSAYDDLIENNLRRIAILEEMAQSLYREWFVHFRFPGHETVQLVDSELGQIPEGWEVKMVQDFGTVVTGKTPSKKREEYFKGDVPFLKTPDMHGNTFILRTNESLTEAGAASQPKKTLPRGSICVSCIGTLGVVSITTEPCQTNQQINSVVLGNEAYREFLFFWFRDAKQKLENLGSSGATMGNVNKSKFESMELLSPPLDLLSRYQGLAHPILGKLELLMRTNQTLRESRDLLLPKLLS